MAPSGNHERDQAAHVALHEHGIYELNLAPAFVSESVLLDVGVLRDDCSSAAATVGEVLWQVKGVTEAARMARRMAMGDPDARALLADWVVDPETGSAHSHEEHEHDEPPEDHAHHGDGPAKPTLFNPATLVDLVLGVGLLGAADATRFGELRARLESIAVRLESLVELRRLTAQLGLGEPALRRRLGRLDSHVHASGERRCATCGMLDTLDRLVAEWSKLDPLGVLMEAAASADLPTIHSADGAVFRQGAQITLYPPAEDRFPEDSGDLQVWLGDAHTTVEKWSPKAIVVTSPPSEGVAHFRHPLKPKMVAEAQRRLDEALRRSGCAHLPDAFLASVPIDRVVLPSRRPAPAIKVLADPFVELSVSGADYGPKGERLVPAGEEVTLRYSVLREPDDVAEISLRIGEETYPLDTSKGSITLMLHEELSISSILEERVLREVTLGLLQFLRVPPRISVQEGEWTEVAVRLPSPARADTTVTIRHGGGIVTPTSITIFAGTQERRFALEGVEAGQPDQPRTTLRVSARGYHDAESVVWVASRLGTFTAPDAREQLGVVGVHAVLLKTGKVLFFSYDHRGPGDGPDDPNRGRPDTGLSQLWDPETRRAVSPAHWIDTNPFCAGQCVLPDGRVLVAGGHTPYDPTSAWTTWQAFWTAVGGGGADHRAHVVDPETGVWTRLGFDLDGARWYPTCTVLPDGDTLVAAGRAASAPASENSSYEIFERRPAARLGGGGGFGARPTGLGPTGHFMHDCAPYPAMHVLPRDAAGRTLVFVHEKNITRLWHAEERRFLDFSATIPGRNHTYPTHTACTLLPLREDRPVQVLLVGGSSWSLPRSRSAPATPETWIFEFDRSQPSRSAWRPGPRLLGPRFMADCVLLPDGGVFVVNGAAQGYSDDSTGAVLDSEILYPRPDHVTSDGTWTRAAALHHARMYHSVALLLPDATVLVTGNTASWNPQNPLDDLTVQIYSPRYLFRGPRPQIDAAPSTLRYGELFSVTTPETEDVRSAVLVRPGAVTHCNDMDQRVVRCAIAGRDVETGRLDLRAPADGSWAPPGFYMLFIVDRWGVPSRANFVSIG